MNMKLLVTEFPEKIGEMWEVIADFSDLEKGGMTAEKLLRYLRL